MKQQKKMIKPEGYNQEYTEEELDDRQKKGYTIPLNIFSILVTLLLIGCTRMVDTAPEEYMVVDGIPPPVDEDVIEDIEIISIKGVPVDVACGSDSMGLMMACGTVVYKQDIKDNEFDEGRVYIYKKENKTVIHRLVKDCRQGCYGLIFKGDNNYKADTMVPEEDVLSKVIMVEYD